MPESGGLPDGYFSPDRNWWDRGFYPDWQSQHLDGPAQPDLTPAPDSAPWPDTILPPDTVPPFLTAPFFFDFEKDDGKLSATGDWEWGKLAFVAGANCAGYTPTPPSVGYSGTGVWGTVLNDCYSAKGNADNPCSNVDLTDDSVLTLEFMLPSTMQAAYLVYWEWTDYFLDFDWTEVYIQGAVVKQHCSGSYVKPTAWVQQVIDLKSYLGQKVTVEWHFMATTVVNYSGWYIDNIEVTDQTPPP